MLIVIGGKRSSSVRGQRAVAMERPFDVVDGVTYCDCGKEAVATLLGIGPTRDVTYILEHAYFALDSRNRSKSVTELAAWVITASKQNTVVVLTHEVRMIDKRVREAADLKFDFS